MSDSEIELQVAVTSNNPSYVLLWLVVLQDCSNPHTIRRVSCGSVKSLHAL